MATFELPADFLDQFRALQQQVASLATRVNSLGGQLGASRIVWGVVANGGAIVAGSGFTSVRNATGDYTIAFSPVFSGAPAVVATTGSEPGLRSVEVKDSTPVTSSAARLTTYNTLSGAIVDADFAFIAMGPA